MEHFDWSTVAEVIVAATLGAWAWMLKTIGRQHVATLNDVVKELREMRREQSEERAAVASEIAALKARVAVVEYAQQVKI